MSTREKLRRALATLACDYFHGNEECVTANDGGEWYEAGFFDWRGLHDAAASALLDGCDIRALTRLGA